MIPHAEEKEQRKGMVREWVEEKTKPSNGDRRCFHAAVVAFELSDRLECEMRLLRLLSLRNR